MYVTPKKTHSIIINPEQPFHFLLDLGCFDIFLPQRFPEPPPPYVLCRRCYSVRPQILLLHLVRILLLRLLRRVLICRLIILLFADDHLAYVCGFVETLAVDRFEGLNDGREVDYLGGH